MSEQARSEALETHPQAYWARRRSQERVSAWIRLREIIAEMDATHRRGEPVPIADLLRALDKIAEAELE